MVRARDDNRRNSKHTGWSKKKIKEIRKEF